MKQQRYENLQAAIDEARQTRHDLRHHLNQLSALAQEGDMEKLRAYLDGISSRIPSLEMSFCENRAADSVAGYYCALAKREIKLTAYLHGESLVLIKAQNAFDGEIHEKGGVFQSSKRKGNGIGIQSVRHIAEKSGGACTFSYSDGIFCAKVMLRG